jgi:membrane protein
MDEVEGRGAAEAPDRRPGPRGEQAARPGAIPARGWKEVMGRVKQEIGNDHLTIVAAGIAFYLFLALFPGLFAAVSIYGLLADPAEVERQVREMSAVLPPAALEIVGSQLHDIVRTSPTSLGFGAALSILFALWSASKGAKALISGINIAYDEEEKRGFAKLQGIALLLTLGFVVFLAATVTAIAVVPSLFGRLGSAAGILLTFTGQWVGLLVLVLLALAVVYRYAPSRDEPRWTWVSLGSFIAAGMWLAASVLFSWYATNFGSFNETYGAIAGVVVLLLWLQVTAFVVLLGAELNAELEHQTVRDTTTGEPQPMGSRGAAKADTRPGEQREPVRS